MAIPLFLYFLNYTIGRKLLSDIMMGIKPRTSIAGATAHAFEPKPLPWWQFFVSDKKISSKKDYFSSFQFDQAWSVTSELFDDSLFPHKQLSRKIHNVELFFDVIVKGSVLRRKFDDRIRYCCMGGRMMVLKLMSKLNGRK